jgi:NADH-quinone oxidoreductase E subunit
LNSEKNRGKLYRFMDIQPEDLEQILAPYRQKRGVLIPVLQQVQQKYGYVPRGAVEIIANELDIAPVDIYGLLTFYAQFYMEPRGRHTIKVCQGTACYIMGGKDILDHLSSKLKIEIDETTPDGKFSLETVACLGCCGMAPVVVIDDDFHGHCTVKTIDNVLDTYE